MKKIVVALDAVVYNAHALDYAIGIAKRSGGMILGVFLHDISYMYVPTAVDLIPIQYSDIIQQEHDDNEKLKLHLKLFNDKCNQENIKHKAHIYNGENILDFLVNESVFADILVMDEQMSFAHVASNNISSFLTDVLSDAHCPVLIVPENPALVENVFLCYDGTPSSVYAIKMYAYLFPAWSQKTTTLISFNKTSSNHLKDSENIKDLLHQHFPYLIIDVEYSMKTDAEIADFFKLYGNNGFIVMGAYGRNSISRLFKRSLADTIIKKNRLPIFITHQ